MFRIGVDEIVLRTLEDDDEAHGKDAAAQIGEDPVCFCSRGPAIDEEAGGREKTAQKHGRDAVFGLAGGVEVDF